jgi:hypothetical protein
LFGYLFNIKKVDASILMQCIHILETIAEYQADILPLADLEYAQAQQSRFAGVYLNSPDIYVRSMTMYKLSSRAVALHEAEKELEKLPSS